MSALHEKIRQFLHDFKGAILLDYVKWLPRPEERQHLMDLCITQKQALDLIKGFTPENYSKGPEPDDTKPDREIWIFGCNVDGTEAYVKLALQPDNKKRNVTYGLIWSFHKADYPLKYPFRGES